MRSVLFVLTVTALAIGSYLLIQPSARAEFAASRMRPDGPAVLVVATASQSQLGGEQPRVREPAQTATAFPIAVSGP